MGGEQHGAPGTLSHPACHVLAQLARGQDSGTPSGVLVGYADVFGHPAFRAAGVPALPASGAYADTPDVIAGRVRAVLALSEEQRPRVLFLSASAWGNSVDGLAAALAPLSAEGVTFVTPSQALACVP